MQDADVRLTVDVQEARFDDCSLLKWLLFTASECDVARYRLLIDCLSCLSKPRDNPTYFPILHARATSGEDWNWFRKVLSEIAGSNHVIEVRELDAPGNYLNESVTLIDSCLVDKMSDGNNDAVGMLITGSGLEYFHEHGELDLVNIPLVVVYSDMEWKNAIMQRCDTFQLRFLPLKAAQRALIEGHFQGGAIETFARELAQTTQGWIQGPLSLRCC